MSNVTTFPRRRDPDSAETGTGRTPAAPVFMTTETYDIWWLISIMRRRMKLLLVIVTVIPVLTALYVSFLPKQGVVTLT
ncbi:hypothetical protein BAL199_11941 [alpha proteobacterium BAL199]|jgi:polysaccharide biosynthesis transport protein|nr:hypothetical protein BAL199_11941 [alpha proteobacterium BAL199]